MNQLAPGQLFTIVEQLGDPSDISKNYVQFVVSYSATSKLITTLNASNPSGQRFTATFTPPSDVGGLGYWIDIKTTVYTDSGYSSINANYPIALTQYFVFFNPNNISNQTGGGYDGLDERTLIKILEKVLGKHIIGIHEKIGNIKIPEYKPARIDFSPLTSKVDEAIQKIIENTNHHITTHGKIDSLHGSVKALPAPKDSEKVDFTPLVKRLDDLSRILTMLERGMLTRHAGIERIHEDSKELLDEILLHSKNTFKIERSGPPGAKLVKKEPELDPIIKKLVGIETPYA